MKSYLQRPQDILRRLHLLRLVEAIRYTFSVFCSCHSNRKFQKVNPDFPLPPKPSINETLGYWFNHGGAIVFPVLALIPLVMVALYLRRRLVADAEGIGYVGKDKIAWDTVEKLDTSRWESKGILVIRATGDVSLSLDEWKLDKKTFRDLIALVENSVPAEAR